MAVVIDTAVDADVAAPGPQDHAAVAGCLGVYDGVGLLLGGGAGGNQFLKSGFQLVGRQHLHSDGAGVFRHIGQHQVCAEIGSVNAEAVASCGGDFIGDVFAVQIQANRGLGGNDGLTGHGHILCQEIVALCRGQRGGGGPGRPHILGAVTAGLVGLFLTADTAKLAQHQTFFCVDDLGAVQVGEEFVGVGCVGGIGEQTPGGVHTDHGLGTKGLDHHSGKTAGLNGQVGQAGFFALNFSIAAEHHGCLPVVGAAGVRHCHTAIDEAAVHVHGAIDHKYIPGGTGCVALTGLGVDAEAAADGAAVHGKGTVNVQVTCVLQGSAAGDGTAVHHHLGLGAANVQIAAVFFLIDRSAAINAVAVDGHGGGAVHVDVAAQGTGTAVSDHAAVKLYGGAGGNKEIAAHAAGEGGLAAGVGCGSLGIAAFNDAVGHDKLAGHQQGTAQTGRILVVGNIIVRIGCAADDLTAQHIEIGGGGDIQGNTVGFGGSIAGIQRALVQIQLTGIQEYAGTVGALVTVGGQLAVALLTGIHDGKNATALADGIDARILSTVDRFAVQINTDILIFGVDGLGGFHGHIVHQLIVTGAEGHSVCMEPLTPLHGLFAVLAIALVIEHKRGAVINKHMGQLSCHVLDDVDTVTLHRHGSAAGLAL